MRTSKVTLLTTMAWHLADQAHNFLSWTGSWGKVGMRPQVPLLTTYTTYFYIFRVCGWNLKLHTHMYVCMCVYLWVMYKYRGRYKCSAIGTFECLLSTKSFNSRNPTVALWGTIIITMLKTSQYSVERVSNLFKTTGLCMANPGTWTWVFTFSSTTFDCNT